jgi:hypothetical protein
MALTNTTLKYAVDDYSTLIQVTSATGFVAGNPLRVGNEYMKIQGVNGTQISVFRGIRGTKCQAHAALADIVTGPWVDFPVEQFPTAGSYTYDASGALTVAPGIHKIAKVAAAAMTLAVPTYAQEGLVMSILALTTAATHTVTVDAAADAVAGFGGIGAGGDVASFGTVGDTLTIVAVKGRWYVQSLNSVSFS